MFAAVTFDLDYKNFVVYITCIINLDLVYFFSRAYISLLKAAKALTTNEFEHAYFPNIFSPVLAAKLLKHIKINDYTIEFIDSKKSSYKSIYIL